ncbi:Transcription factor AP-1 [Sciurus carolinensis]|uniref:Transcription factor AP-1 n=1 Tax=Sciurus carolinensis TaxID=30640 RepID=A0AA41MYR7_SCICA|nr:Transcription factor AP-1 [Sciurus carolinensis]
MTAKMETTFYDDALNASFLQIESDAYGYSNPKILKQSMTLNLDDPVGSLKPHLRAKSSDRLTSPYLRLLKLASPELEDVLIQSSNGHVTTTRTSIQFLCPNNVTDEQEGFGEGFVGALAELHSQNSLPSVPSAAQPVSGAGMVAPELASVAGGSGSGDSAPACTGAVPPFCGPLFRRQQKADEETKTSLQYETGKRYSAKELKETKARLRDESPPFIFTVHNVIPKEHRKASRVPRRGRTFSPERHICAEKKHLFSKERTTTDLSQLAFERQFHFSRLRQNKEAEKKGLVLRTRAQRPRSWAAGDQEQRWGPQPVERRVMTAEVLGKHLASLQGMARQGHHCNKVTKLHWLLSAVSYSTANISPLQKGRILQEMSR